MKLNDFQKEVKYCGFNISLIEKKPYNTDLYQVELNNEYYLICVINNEFNENDNLVKKIHRKYKVKKFLNQIKNLKKN